MKISDNEFKTKKKLVFMIFKKKLFSLINLDLNKLIMCVSKNKTNNRKTDISMRINNVCSHKQLNKNWSQQSNDCHLSANFTNWILLNNLSVFR